MALARGRLRPPRRRRGRRAQRAAGRPGRRGGEARAGGRGPRGRDRRPGDRRHLLARGRAARRCDAGAAAINDIGGAADREMLELVAEAGCGYVLMHIEGPPRVDRDPPAYGDAVEHLKRWFAERIEAAIARRGGPRSRSPSTRASTSTSRSTTTSRSCAGSASCASSAGRCSCRSRARTSSARCSPAPGSARLGPDEREGATAAATALAAAAGAELLRLHDASALDAMRVAAAIATRSPRASMPDDLGSAPSPPGSGCSSPAETTGGSSHQRVEPRAAELVAPPGSLSLDLVEALARRRDRRALLASARGARAARARAT